MSNILSMEWKLLQVMASLNGLIFSVYHYLMKIKTVILLDTLDAPVIKLLKYRFSVFKAESLLMIGNISQVSNNILFDCFTHCNTKFSVYF